MSGLGGGGFAFDEPNNKRDIFVGADCDAGCLKFAELLGWKDELKEAIDKYHASRPARKPKDEALRKAQAEATIKAVVAAAKEGENQKTAPSASTSSAAASTASAAAAPTSASAAAAAPAATASAAAPQQTAAEAFAAASLATDAKEKASPAKPKTPPKL